MLNPDDDGNASVMLALLRRRMVAARDERTALKRMMQNAEFLLEHHHSAYALENVTLDREVGELRDRMRTLRMRVAQLEHDAANATAERERLLEQNESLLAAVQLKEEAKQDFRERQRALAVTERRCGRFSQRLFDEVSTLQGRRAVVTGNQQTLVQNMGANQTAVLAGEQSLLDSKIDVDATRAKLSIPQRRGEVPLPYEAFFAPCDEPSCQNANKIRDSLRDKLASLEAMMSSAQIQQQQQQTAK
jgi:chromosome segregation ATPase